MPTRGHSFAACNAAIADAAIADAMARQQREEATQLARAEARRAVIQPRRPQRGSRAPEVI
jgi:hypothetical protein